MGEKQSSTFELLQVRTTKKHDQLYTEPPEVVVVPDQLLRLPPKPLVEHVSKHLQ
jgi:hypothetical protein